MSDLLKRARTYLADPKHWTQGEMWRDKFGSACKREEATCACLLGSLAMVGRGFTNPEYRETRDILNELAPRGVVPFNDDPTTTHADVLALLDKAIDYEANLAAA